MDDTGSVTRVNTRQTEKSSSDRYDAGPHVENGIRPSRNRSPRSLKHCIYRHLTSDIRINMFTDIELLILTFLTGITSATVFLDYHCFASNQSGNTVLLGFAIADQGRDELFMPSIIAVNFVCFLLGNMIVAQIGHHCFTPRKRWWVVFTNLVSTCLIFAAAALQYQFGVHLSGGISLLGIALLSLGVGTQTVLSRSFQTNEISTGFATAAWVDIVVDEHLFAKKNYGRNRRLAFVILLFLGALIGACMYGYVSRESPLVMTAAGKTLVTILYLFNPSEEEDKPTVEGTARALSV